MPFLLPNGLRKHQFLFLWLYPPGKKLYLKALPDDLKNLPEDVKAVGRLLFDDCQKRARGELPWAGVYFKDVLDFDKRPKVGTVVPEGFVYAELIKDVDWEVDEKNSCFLPFISSERIIFKPGLRKVISLNLVSRTL